MKAHNLHIWLLALAFGAPFAAGWFLFLNPNLLPGGGGGASHGELIQPPRPTGGIRLEDRQGRQLPLADLQGKWVLLLSSEHCNGECPEMLWKLRQVRLALGAGRDRVERILLLHAPAAAGFARLLAEQYPQMPVARPVRDTAARGADIRSLLGEPGEEALFIIDPMGNLMMRYPSGVRAEDILEDMERLLKVSEHWGKP